MSSIASKAGIMGSMTPQNRDGLFFTLLIRDIKEHFGFTYPELAVVLKREDVIPRVAEDFGILHYYGSEDIIDILESDMNVSFARP
jgi:hypothetical protein